MQIDAPACCQRGVGKFPSVLDVLLTEYHVPEQPARLAFSANIGRPCQLSVRILGLISALILLKSPVAINSLKKIIADKFKVCNLVFIKAGLPIPVTPYRFLAAFFGKLQRLGTIRERSFFLVLP